MRLTDCCDCNGEIVDGQPVCFAGAGRCDLGVIVPNASCGLDHHCHPGVAPTPTATHTPAPRPSPTSTPNCAGVQISGQVFDVNAKPSAGRRLTIETTFEQRIGNCFIHISHLTVQLDQNGVVPLGATAVPGSVIRISLEGDIPFTTTMPSSPPPVPLSTLVKNGN